MKIGEYKRGADAVADQAIDRIERIRSFLRQSTDEHVGFDDTLAQMNAAIS